MTNAECVWDREDASRMGVKEIDVCDLPILSERRDDGHEKGFRSWVISNTLLVFVLHDRYFCSIALFFFFPPLFWIGLCLPSLKDVFLFVSA